MCKFCKLYISIYYYVSPINKVSLSLVLIWRHIKWMLTKLDMHSWCPGVKYCWSLSLSISDIQYPTLSPMATQTAPLRRRLFQLRSRCLILLFSEIAGPRATPASSPSRLWLKFRYSRWRVFWNLHDGSFCLLIYWFFFSSGSNTGVEDLPTYDQTGSHLNSLLPH